jgi:acyl-CoA dehydrogenase
VHRLTGLLALALAPEVRVNAVAPGLVPTRLFDEAMGDEAAAVADADLDAAAKGAAMSVFTNSGQICHAGSRLFVERSIYDEFVGDVAKVAKGLKVGNGLDPETEIGPVVSQNQLRSVTGYLDAGRAEGATVVAGGERLTEGALSDGYFVAPTVFAQVTDDMTIAREEIFGPLIGGWLLGSSPGHEWNFYAFALPAVIRCGAGRIHSRNDDQARAGRPRAGADLARRCRADHLNRMSTPARTSESIEVPDVNVSNPAPAVSPEDFEQIRALVHEFIRSKVVPREQEIMASDAIPDDLRKQVAELGLFGYAIPQEWGGLGLDLTQDVELAFEFGYTSLAMRSMFGTDNGIAGQVLVNFGTDEQKSQWLERIASGDVVASFALIEPGAGSNPAGLRTKAVRDGDGWVIDGQKCFITNAPIAGLFVAFARTRPADESGTGIAVFLVPAATPGVQVGTKDKKMGQEGAWTADVTFSGVRVPNSALVGGDEDTGYRAAMTSLTRGHVHIAALAVGTAQRALDESVAYAATATQGGTPIGDFQLVQAMLADQQTGVLAGRALVRETARRYLSGEDRRIGPSAAKLYCTEMAGKVADLAVQVHGGSGYMREVPVERIYRDVRLLRLYEGTSEIQRLIIGSNLIKAAQKGA